MKILENGIKSLLSIMCMMVLVLQSTVVMADADPVKMLEGVTQRVMTSIKGNKSEYKRNSSKLYAMVNQQVLPHIDFTEMARWVAGRQAWQASDAETQALFVQELKRLVVRTYAKSLLAYNDQTIEFLPLRAPAGGKERIQVSSYIRDGAKSPIRLDYRLIRAGGSWRVYDIIIEGVSLMQGYRNQFAEEIRRAGIEGAIEKLRRHNSR